MEQTQQQPQPKRQRGDGRIFLRGKTYWCSFYVRGKGEMRESCRTEDAKQAAKYLRARIKATHVSELDLSKPFLTITDHKRTVSDLMAALADNFKLRGKDSPQNLSTIARVRKDFGSFRATSLTAENIARYVRDQLESGYRPASINRITTILRQGYKLVDLPCPKIVKLSEADNTRRGFFENDQIRRVIASMQDHGKPVPDLTDFVLFAALTGMRKGEIASMRWQDLENDLLVLRGENAKNGHARTIPLEGELTELIARRRARRAVKVDGTVVLSDLIFHRKAKPIKEFRKCWRTACKMAGVPDRLFHDLRRSAVRDLVRSGVSQAVAKSISGHKTDAMFARYNISDVNDQRKALARVQEYRLESAKEAEQRASAASAAIN